MSSIFISHSSKDNAIAVEIREWLFGQGHRSVFLDFHAEDGIPAGRDWEQELYHQLRACQAVIVLCSLHSMASAWVFAEITHARALGKQIFPVSVADCSVHPLLQSQQIIDLTIDKEEGYGRLVQALKASGLDPTDAFAWDGSRPPYPGLGTFQEEDAAVFFGRDAEIQEGLEQLYRLRQFGGARMLVVLGTSGSGKSSLVRAGLLPRLRKNPDAWLVVRPLRSHGDPFREAAIALSQAFGRLNERRSWREIKQQLTAEADGEGWQELALDLSISAGRREATVIITVDQTEELLSSPDSEASLQFLSSLRGALDKSDGQLMAIFTLRSDFLADFQAHSALRGSTWEDILIGPMMVDQFAKIIEGPADLSGIQLEPGLTMAMVEDTETEDALPLLAFTLRELYERFGRSDHRLEIEEYRDKLGGLAGSVAKAAEAAYSAGPATDGGDNELRKAFLRMVRVNEEGRYVNKRAYWPDFPESVQPVLERFVQARLLVSAGEGEARLLGVTHESLFRSWERLADWLEEDRGFLLWRRRLTEARRIWERSGKDDGSLLRGATLAEAEEWLARQEHSLGQEEQEYIQSSIELRESDAAEQRRINAQLRSRATVLAILAIVAIAAAAVAAFFGLQADRESRQARARELASAAVSQRDSDPELALLLAIEAASRHQDFEVEQALRDTLESFTWRPTTLEGHEDSVTGVAFAPDGQRAITISDDGTALLWELDSLEVTKFEGHEGPITSVVFGNDGERILTASEDGKARLWNLEGEIEETYQAHESDVLDAVFSPDEKYVLTTSTDGTAVLWSSDGEQIEILVGHGDDVVSAEFNSTGDRVLTASADGTARLWDLDGNLLTRYEGDEDELVGAHFGPDDKSILTHGNDSSARLWEANNGASIAEFDQTEDGRSAIFSPDGQTILTAGGPDFALQEWDLEGQVQAFFPGHSRQVRDISFSPDGEYILSSSADGTARLWGPTDQTSSVLRGHTLDVASAVFSPNFGPDEQLILTASWDDTARLWTGLGPSFPIIEGHEGSVENVSFSPGGQLILTASDDRTAGLWTRDGELLVTFEGHEDDVETAAFSPDGNLILTASDDMTAGLWNLAGERLVTLQGHADGIESAVFSPDGLRVLTASNDRTARLWDLNGKELVNFVDHEDEVEMAVFSPDGQLIVSASDDETARIWNLRGEQQASLEGHEGAVVTAEFSPDGTRVLTASDDKTARLWDLDGRLVDTFTGHTAGLSSAVFSPDGQMILTASSDRTARLWDDLESQTPITLQGHNDVVRRAEFSPDGHTILTYSNDGTARLWDLEGRPLAILRGHLDSVVSAAFSSDGKRVATASRDETVRQFLVDAGDLLSVAVCRVGRGVNQQEIEQFGVGEPIFIFEERACPPAAID